MHRGSGRRPTGVGTGDREEEGGYRDKRERKKGHGPRLNEKALGKLEARPGSGDRVLR